MSTTLIQQIEDVTGRLRDMARDVKSEADRKTIREAVILLAILRTDRETRDKLRELEAIAADAASGRDGFRG
jgi:hypothetical protein